MPVLIPLLNRFRFHFALSFETSAKLRFKAPAAAVKWLSQAITSGYTYEKHSNNQTDTTNLPIMEKSEKRKLQKRCRVDHAKNTVKCAVLRLLWSCCIWTRFTFWKSILIYRLWPKFEVSAAPRFSEQSRSQKTNQKLLFEKKRRSTGQLANDCLQQQLKAKHFSYGASKKLKHQRNLFASAMFLEMITRGAVGAKLPKDSSGETAIK